MRKKIMLGSVLITLLMLVTTQTMFMENVLSWPSEHTGDADVGDMWVTELNTTSVLNNVKNVSIGHANATHDWVKWLAGVGTVKADWSVDIGDKHPEYWIRFYLSVYHIDDNCTELGNASFRKEYSANTSYTESGTLTILVEFTQAFISANTNATLLCLLDATATINDTAEAENFTSWSQDRCVVGVSLDSEESSEPFSRFTIETNEEWPHSWSYLDGWNESGRFDDEEDMLNNQTHFMNGKCTLPEVSGDWKLGDITFTLYKNDVAKVTGWSKGQTSKTVQIHGDGKFDVTPYFDVYVTRHSGNAKYINVRWNALREGFRTTNLPGSTKCNVGETTEVGYRWYRNFENWDIIDDDKIEIYGGWIYPKTQWRHIWLFGKYTIDKGDDGGSGSASTINHYWESSCVYQNGSINFGVSSSSVGGITTVQVNISSMLQSQSSDEIFYTFAGDRGDTRIETTI